MEVILIKDVEKLGYANDIVNVKPGYANNYLIPQGYAKAATASARKVLAENLKQRALTRTPRFWPTLRLWPRSWQTCPHHHRQGRGGQDLRFGHVGRYRRGSGCQGYYG